MAKCSFQDLKELSRGFEEIALSRKPIRAQFSRRLMLILCTRLVERPLLKTRLFLVLRSAK